MPIGREPPIGQVPGPLPRGVEAMPVITPDQVTLHIEGERFWTDRDGPHAIQVAQVVGLRGNPDARLYYASLAPGIPRYGQYHKVLPYLPVSLVSAEYPDKGTSDIANVTITFGFSSVGAPVYFANDPSETTLPQVEILTSVQPATTQFEILPDGAKRQIVVARDLPPPEGEPGPPGREEQAGSVDYQLPMKTVRFMRREPRNAEWKADLYVGTISKVGVFGDPPHYAFCTRLGSVSDDGGATWNVTYEFQRHPDSWDPWVIFTDPVTGKPLVLPRDPATGQIQYGESLKQVTIFPEMDFWQLNLTLPNAPGVADE